jgi:hypothetical protein
MRFGSGKSPAGCEGGACSPELMRGMLRSSTVPLGVGLGIGAVVAAGIGGAGEGVGVAVALVEESFVGVAGAGGVESFVDEAESFVDAWATRIGMNSFVDETSGFCATFVDVTNWVAC